LQLEFHGGRGNAVYAEVSAFRELQGYDGLLHGGVISALLDAAMTHCLFRREIEALTADLHVRFLQPVRCDSVLELRARILSEKHPLYRLRAELRFEKQVMAWAEGKFLQRSECGLESVGTINGAAAL
jgi:acyl-coenzyme A thioesterase PaaI-like protein